jgi:hypothetical protein
MADDISRRGPNPRTPDTGDRRYATAGTRTSYAERTRDDARWLAEDLAESVPGVREVHNRLRVAHG